MIYEYVSQLITVFGINLVALDDTLYKREVDCNFLVLFVLCIDP